MIVLDTNVVSEPLRARPDRTVVAWLDRQAANSVFITATSLSELLAGVELLPSGKRKAALQDDLKGEVSRLFGTLVLPFDAEAAHAYASLSARARATGLVISVPDAQIAAIAHVKGFSVATRDTAPFLAAGVRVLDPWIAGDL